MRRIVLGAAVAVTLVACTKKDASLAAPPAVASASATATATASAAPAASGVDASAPDATAWPSELPVPRLPPAAPAVVDGYPKPLRTCLPDPTYLAGYSTDGTLFGYCEHSMGIRCELVDATGAHRHDAAGGPDSDAKEKAKVAAIDRATRAIGIPELLEKDCNYLPNPLRGTFRYGDITLKVLPVEGSVLKVGGSVGGGAPVYPYVYSRPSKGEYSNGTELNVLALSPSGDEIGLITHTNCMEWCDEFEIVRMPVDRIAAGIYNDAGFRAYKAKDLAGARELFLRAAYLDPMKDLAAYNLACTYALEHDATHAEAALKLAVARGGAAVKARARADKDFGELKGAPWFRALTAP